MTFVSTLHFLGLRSHKEENRTNSVTVTHSTNTTEKRVINKQITNPMEHGRAMAQAVSRRPLTADARVRSRVSPYEICGGQSRTGTGFSPSCRFSLVNFIPLVLH
jgi:hypothetical protein